MYGESKIANFGKLLCRSAAQYRDQSGSHGCHHHLDAARRAGLEVRISDVVFWQRMMSTVLRRRRGSRLQLGPYRRHELLLGGVATYPVQGYDG